MDAEIKRTTADGIIIRMRKGCVMALRVRKSRGTGQRDHGLDRWEKQVPDEIIDREDMEMEAVAKSMPVGIRCIKLYRMQGPNKGGRPSYISDLPPEQFSEAYIKQTWGGGSYFGRWEKKDGTMLRYPFDIEGVPKAEVVEEEEEEEETRNTFPANAVSVQAPGITPFEMFKMLQDARKEAREEFQIQMQTIMKAMAPSPPAPDISEKVFGVIEKIMPLMQQGGGDGGGGAWWMPLLMAFKEPISKIADTVRIAYEQKGPAGQATTVTSTPTPAPASMLTPTTAQPSQESDMIMLMMKQVLPSLVRAGIKGADTMFHAEWVLDQVPEGAYPGLREFLVKPDCIDTIAKIEPGIRFQGAWWEALRKDIVELIDHPKPPDEPSNGQPEEDL